MQSSQLPAASEKDYALADVLHFDHTIIDALRKVTAAAFSKLAATPDGIDGAQLLQQHALQFPVEGKNAKQLVLSLLTDFRQQGYLIFWSGEHFGAGDDTVAVLKSNDQFDILRFQATNGVNYGISTNDLITALQRWYAQAPFNIIGADMESMEARFIDLPEDVHAFAAAEYEFCPDIVDQGTGTLAALEDEIRNTNRLYLWWD